MIYESRPAMIRALQERIEPLLSDRLSVTGGEFFVLVSGEFTSYRFDLCQYTLSETRGLALFSGQLTHSDMGGSYISPSAALLGITHEQQLIDRTVRVHNQGNYHGDLYNELGYGPGPHDNISRTIPNIMDAWREPLSYREGDRVYEWGGTDPSWDALDRHEAFLADMGGVRGEVDVCDLGPFFDYAFRVYRFHGETHDFYFLPCALPNVRPLFHNIELEPWREPREKLQRMRRSVELYETLTRTICPGEIA